MCVAEHDIEVEFLAGKSNYTADALSRINLPEDIIAVVAPEPQDMNVCPWDLRKLARKQDEHPKWGKLKNYLKGESKRNHRVYQYP